jgi:hypothetical protein
VRDPRAEILKRLAENITAEGSIANRPKIQSNMTNRPLAAPIDGVEGLSMRSGLCFLILEFKTKDLTPQSGNQHPRIISSIRK